MALRAITLGLWLPGIEKKAFTLVQAPVEA
jgi:hypothetical protein